ncbi:hypothetical protein SDC9_174208 [bioreactor metagenome]|uniref:Uncharacterized protein n=1 Tax=bioreactor metagenome TaxID=1076179 RepID=A0A645GT36_9ZZZZ
MHPVTIKILHKTPDVVQNILFVTRVKKIYPLIVHGIWLQVNTGFRTVINGSIRICSHVYTVFIDDIPKVDFYFFLMGFCNEVGEPVRCRFGSGGSLYQQVDLVNMVACQLVDNLPVVVRQRVSPYPDPHRCTAACFQV